MGIPSSTGSGPFFPSAWLAVASVASAANAAKESHVVSALIYHPLLIRTVNSTAASKPIAPHARGPGQSRARTSTRAAELPYHAR
jgi:hypothetical protein